MIHGVGIDIVEIEHMKRVVARHPNIVYKILTKQEHNELVNASLSPTELHEDKNFVETLAGRFAAKEALVKSLGKSLFSVGMGNIAIIRNPSSGAPEVRLNINDENVAGIDFLCSITHSHVSAAAVVIAQKG